MSVKRKFRALHTLKFIVLIVLNILKAHSITYSGNHSKYFNTSKKSARRPTISLDTRSLRVRLGRS